MRSKIDIRKEMKKKRAELPLSLCAKKSEDICRFLENTEVFLSAKNILFFAPSFNEPNILPLAEKYFGKKTILFPRVHQKTRNRKQETENRKQTSQTIQSLSIKEVTDLSQLENGSFGILEPKENIPDFSPENLDLVLLPALAIDKKGNRLGFGGGFYDCFLSGLVVKKIAIIYDFQWVTEIPSQSFDIPVDGTITEEGVFLF